MEQKHKIISAVSLIGLVISFIIIFYLARGYQIDIRNRQLKGTGTLVITSVPKGAMVYLDEEPYSATNTSISSLKPGRYKAKIQKQGYSTWEKEITIKKEIVTEINALLTPLFPELKPLTFTGAQNPLLSPDRQKILFSATIDGETSLWLLEIVERPFNLPSRPRQLVTDTQACPYSQATKQWSPDSQSLLMSLEKEVYLLNVSNKSLKFVDDPEKIKHEWHKEVEAEEQKRLQKLLPHLIQKVTEPTEGQWSPDYNSFLYQTSEGKEQIFKIISLSSETTIKPNITEKVVTEADERPLAERTIYTAPKDKFVKLVWYPDSEHLIILEKEDLENNQGSLSLIETDGENKSEFFSGIVKGNYVFPFANGTKVAILTSFNPETEIYNLYAIGLR